MFIKPTCHRSLELNVWMMHFMQLSGKALFNDNKETVSREILAQCLVKYESSFMGHYQRGMCKKLGLPWESLNNNAEAVTEVINDTLKLAF